MSMFNDKEKAKRRMFSKCQSRQSTCKRNFVLDNGHLLVQSFKRSGVHKELGIIPRTLLKCLKRTSYFPCNDSIVQGCSQEQRTWKTALHCRFCIIISTNQLSIYGAVAAKCEEFETHQDGSGEPDVLMGQSIVLCETKAEIPLQNKNSSNHQIP